MPLSHLLVYALASPYLLVVFIITSAFGAFSDARKKKSRHRAARR
jgi:hypothetical protein